MGSNPLLIIGVMVALGVAVNFLRLWTFVSGGANNRRAKMARITDMDAHLSFDERIAERMRELENERGTGSPAPPAPPQGFGRRSL